jgi:hypothetical protein
LFFKTTLIFLLIGFLGGCATDQPKVNTRPEWVDNPYIANKTVAVGTAQTHYYGKVAQRKLAISRALDELAAQQGVKVSSLVKRHDQRDGSRASAKSDIYSFQTTDNRTVHAHIKATWTDPRTDEIYIWMVAD